MSKTFSASDGDIDSDPKSHFSPVCASNKNGPDWFTALAQILRTIKRLNPEFPKCLAQTCDNFERVGVILDQPHVIQMIDHFIDRANGQMSSSSTNSKSAAKANNYREAGNKAYREKRLHEAAIAYTASIRYAPIGSESAELPLAYGNRSATFFELAKWQFCLDDINLAFDAGYARHRRARKLLIRRIECLIALNRFAEARRRLHELPEHDPTFDALEDDRAQRLRLELIDFDEDFDVRAEVQRNRDSRKPLTEIVRELARLRLYEPSRDLLSLSAKASMRYDDAGNRGRFLVAAQRIEPGDIIAVELPAASVLLKPFETDYCHHCHRFLGLAAGDLPNRKIIGKQCNDSIIIGSIVGCDSCIEVLFCSASCRTAASAYHSIECGRLVILHQIGIAHLALRLLLLVGVDVIRHVVAGNSNKNHEENHISVAKKDATDLETYYERCYHLAHHSDRFDSSDLAQYCVTACLVARIVARSGGSPPGAEDNGGDESMATPRFAAGILLRHILQLVVNAHSIAQFLTSRRAKARSSRISSDDFDHCSTMLSSFADIRIASALYPTISLLNHSCDPNVVATFERGSLNIIRASKRIDAGQEIFNSYGVHFARYDRETRREMLASQYFFDCECARCEMEFRDGVGGLDRKYHAIACVECSGLLSRVNPTDDHFRCDRTDQHHVISSNDVEDRFKMIENLVQQIEDLQEDRETSGNNNISKLRRSVANLEPLSHTKSSLSLGKAYDHFAYAILANANENNTNNNNKTSNRMMVDDARRYVEKSCRIVQANFGSASIELCNEMIKLADICRMQIDWSNDDDRTKLKSIDDYRRVVKRALRLLRFFSLTIAKDDNDDDDDAKIRRTNRLGLGDDSCFFGDEHERLTGELALTDKQQQQ